MQWDQIFATRASRMKASEIRELLKLLDQPDIISFAGGIPDPALFPAQAVADGLLDSVIYEASAAYRFRLDNRDVGTVTLASKYNDQLMFSEVQLLRSTLTKKI